jgi:hypothetical protein
VPGEDPAAPGDGPLQAPPSPRIPALFTLAGAALAVVSVPAAGAAGAPYLSFDSLNFWLVVYAGGLFSALFASAFAIHRSPALRRVEQDERWERAALLWGGCAVAVLLAGLALGLPSGFDTGSLAGSLGLITVVDAGLVLATLVVVLASG